MRRFATAAFVAALLLAPGGATARADDSEMGTVGGSVYPVETADVRLDSETVQAICYGSFAEYRVDFKFVNEGAARKVLLGFPFAQIQQRGEFDAYPPVAFQAWQDGRPLAVSVGRGERLSVEQDAPDYFLHEASMKRGANMITVSYLAHPSGMAGERAPKFEPAAYRKTFSMFKAYDYWLHTGWTWKGPIRKAVVRHQLADTFDGWGIELTAKQVGILDYLQHWVTRPRGWDRPLSRTYQWTFTDFDPTPAKLVDPWSKSERFDVTLAYSDPVDEPDAQGAKASSTSKRQVGTGDAAYPEFDARGAIDGGITYSWAEGAAGDGVGEWIRIPLGGERRVRELRIVTGNQRDPATFRQYGRPKELTLEFSDGAGGTGSTIRLRDVPWLQRFPVKTTASSAKLTIQSAYPGSRYEDTAISEVEFGSEPAPRFASFADLIDDPKATGDLGPDAGTAGIGVSADDLTGQTGSVGATKSAQNSRPGGRVPCPGAAWLGVLAVGLLCYTPALRRRVGR
jgi:hypothetical protein